MKRKLTAMAVVLGLFLASWGVQAQEQKIGYVNADSVLASLPETKIQQKKLESYNKQLQSRIQQKQQLFQSKYQDAVKKAEAGAMTNTQQREVQKELQGLQQELQKEQAAAKVNLSSKEEELLQPLYKKMNKAIRVVAERESFTYIMSENMLVFGSETLDVTDIVIQELKSMEQE